MTKIVRDESRRPSRSDFKRNLSQTAMKRARNGGRVNFASSATTRRANAEEKQKWTALTNSMKHC